MGLEVVVLRLEHDGHVNLEDCPRNRVFHLYELDIHAGDAALSGSEEIGEVCRLPGLGQNALCQFPAQ